MHITDFHDAPSITAQYLIEDHLHRAARNAIIVEVGRDRPLPRGYLARMGHVLVGLGERLQAAAQRLAVMKETV